MTKVLFYWAASESFLWPKKLFLCNAQGTAEVFWWCSDAGDPYALLRVLRRRLPSPMHLRLMLCLGVKIYFSSRNEIYIVIVYAQEMQNWHISDNFFLSMRSKYLISLIISGCMAIYSLCIGTNLWILPLQTLFFPPAAKCFWLQWLLFLHCVLAASISMVWNKADYSL